jgi:uncharacterized protein YukE
MISQPDVGALEALASTVRRVAGDVDDSTAATRRCVAALTDVQNWTGATADKFASAWSIDAGQLTLLGNELASIATVIDTLAYEAGAVERNLALLTNELGLPSDDGEVVAARNQLIAYEDIACTRLQTILDSFEAVRATRAVADGGSATVADLEQAEQTGNYASLNAALAKLTPAQVTGFLVGLTPIEAIALATSDPRFIGNLDGVPLALRGAANHLNAEADLAAARSNGDHSKVNVLEALLNDGAALVLYDPSRGHYGVLYGNPDSNHLAVLVPGVDLDHNRSGDLRELMADAHVIQRAAGPDSAVIMWKGYDSPGDRGDLDVINAAFDGRADVGAASLAAFAAGLGRSAGQTLTVIGHSYGSVVTGDALANHGLRPSNVVVLGSPGVTVDSTTGLHLQPSQFFAEKAAGDYVAALAGGYGVDPSSAAFGGTRLATNAPGRPAVNGHSGYWAPGSQSVQGIADVINQHVPAIDVQPPSAGDYVKAPVSEATEIAFGPSGSLVHWLDQNYHGPGSGLVQLEDHLLTGLANVSGSAAGFTVNGLDDGWRDLTRAAAE